MHNAHADRVPTARRDAAYFMSAAALTFLFAGLFFYALSGWLGRPANHAAAFAAAFDALGKVDSMHFVKEADITGGIGSYRFTNLGVLDPAMTGHTLPADWESFQEQTEEDCIVREGTYRYCIIRKRGTGEEVGQVERGYAVHNTAEGTFAAPDSLHYTETWQYDRVLRISGRQDSPAMEKLYVDGVNWSRSGDRYWSVNDLNGSLLPVEADFHLWGLLDVPGRERPGLLDRYGRVERLEDAELDGVLVDRYLARYVEGIGSLEIWVGKEDGLVRTAVKRMEFGAGEEAHSRERTYTFSRFNEPAEMPEPWPCFGAPHC